MSKPHAVIAIQGLLVVGSVGQYMYLGHKIKHVLQWFISKLSVIDQPLLLVCVLPVHLRNFGKIVTITCGTILQMLRRLESLSLTKVTVI